MRKRAFIHIGGPAGSGKTLLVERLLEARLGLAICVRSTQGSQSRSAQAELRRYRAAGVMEAEAYRFAAPDPYDLFGLTFMQTYSNLVLIEGDPPGMDMDLTVFVGPPLMGEPLLRQDRRWSLAPSYVGVERAELVVINVRSEQERQATAPLLEDLARIRSEVAVFRDVVGSRGHRRPVKVVVANLSDPRGAGLKQAVARVNRAVMAAST